MKSHLFSDVAFPANAYVEEGPIEYFEDNGEKCLARWYDVTQLALRGFGTLSEWP